MREKQSIFDLFKHTLEHALKSAKLDAEQIEVGHVGNFVGELFTKLGMLNGFFAQAYPQLNGMASSRHEAACASGSIALLAAMRDI